MKDLRGPSATPWFYLAFVISIVTMLTLFCCTSVARTTPINYVLLFTFTLCETFIVSVVAAHSKPKLVLMALFMTMGIVTALTLYALTTDTDFTLMGGALFLIAMCMLLIGLMVHFTNNKTIHVIYSGISVLFLGLYLIYDL
jgi:hypothetical protein